METPPSSAGSDETEQPFAQESLAVNLPPIVGIGASAGGIHALRDFFSQMATDTGMAFVVILHLSAEHESVLASVLQQVTIMPVHQVTTPTAIEPNTIYVIAPATSLTLADGELQPSALEPTNGPRMAIDRFFRSLAQVQGSAATAVVLSGTGSDGALGLGQVKEYGGLAVVQDPAEAEYGTMPRSAIATGLADLVLPVARIPGQIIAYHQNAQLIRLPDASAQPDADNEALHDLLLLLRLRTGHDFTNYKRATVLRRIARRLQVNGILDLPSYLLLLRDQPDEVPALLRDLLISVTTFFRDPSAFQALEGLIPDLFAGKQADDYLRVWVAACATGEEAYSVAILLLEYATRLPNPPRLQIFATDIDEEALSVARAAVYPDTIAADVSPERLRRFFVEQQGQYHIKKEVRDIVLFATHNVLRDPPFSRLDLITCRNLLIYLDRDMQSRVLELFAFVMRPTGLLMLGSSEMADNSPGLFTVIDKGKRIYGRRTLPGATLPLPALPLAGSQRRSATDSTPPAQPTISFSGLHQRLLEEYAPPSLIINEAYEIVHLSSRVGRFLQLAGGEPSYDLLKVVHPDLRIDLRSALLRATQQGQPTDSLQVPMQVNGETRLINLLVRPMQSAQSAPGFILIIFDDVGAALDTEPIVLEDRSAEPILRQLDAELQRLRDQLRMTIDQYETSTEELKASNEELQAVNEELRSATEELETSKEEVQSINEELSTVNQELKNKVDELSHVNGDLQSLMAAIEIGTLFVDHELRLKRYTPRVLELFNLIESDINRPLTHVTHQLIYPNLINDVIQARDQHVLIDHEIQHQDGRWFLARLLPYQSFDSMVDGVVLTFVEITNRKLAEDALRQAYDTLESRVLERTHELAQTNAALRSEIVVRQQAEDARRQLLRQLVSTQEQERRRISRELHDQLGQQMIGLSLGLQALKEHVQDRPAGVTQIEQLQVLVDGFSQELHHLALDLRPAALDDMGLAAALAGYAEEWSQRSGIPLSIHSESLDDIRLQPEIETILYRVAQEALTNVVKHAHASRVSLILERSDTLVSLIIEDNGQGFDMDKLQHNNDASQRLGLLGMQERVSLFGGTLTIESTANSGTTIFVRVPLDPPRDTQL